MAVDEIGFAAFLIFIAALWIVPFFLKAARFNDDPLQKELAFLIVEYANSDLGTGALMLFTVSTSRAFISSMILNEAEQQTRLAHALSLARRDLTPRQYDFVRQVLRQ